MREEVKRMKNPNIEFNPEGVASLNELLETRELTGQMPETMPIGSELLGYK